MDEKSTPYIRGMLLPDYMSAFIDKLISVDHYLPNVRTLSSMCPLMFFKGLFAGEKFPATFNITLKCHLSLKKKIVIF